MKLSPPDRDHTHYPPDDYGRVLLAGTEHHYPESDKWRARLKALPGWGTAAFDKTAWAALPRGYQYCPPGIYADDDVYQRLYKGETGKQWEARCDALGAVPGSARGKRVALLEKLQRPRERVDEDQAEGKEEDSSNDEQVWEGPSGIPLHAIKSDRDATPDVLAEDIQARNPDFDKQTDLYDRITAARPDERNPVDVQQWFTFPGKCGFSTPLTYSPVTSDLDTGCPTLCGYCVRPPGHEGGHWFSSGDSTGYRGSFVDPGWEAATNEVVLKRREDKRTRPPDMSWYARHWRIDACLDCGQRGCQVRKDCPAGGRRLVV